MSDLDTAPDDVPRVAQTFNTFRSQGVKFRIVALTPARTTCLSSRIWRAAKHSCRISAVSQRRGGQTEGALQGRIPWSLIFVAALVLVALAANEHWNGRLPVPRMQS